MQSFNLESYKEQLNQFPQISYEEYQQITDLQLRKDIAKKNKIIQTDSYNRTMNYLKGPDWSKEEAYTLSLRRSPNKKYVVVDGIRNQIKGLFSTPIAQHELDFAEKFYADQKRKWGNGHFNKAMRQEVIDIHNGYVPLTINAVQDGTALKPKEPAMTVKGPGEIAATYEPLLLRIFFQSVVATDAHYIDQILGEGRVVEFWKRAAPNEDYHLDAIQANIVGASLKITSNDTAALVYPQLRAWGTTAHRYFACYPTEDDAFLNAIEKTDNIALLVDLIDSYAGIDKIIALKKKYRATGKKIAMRLDSGDLAHQAVYTLQQLQKHNMLDPELDKIVVADISTIDDLIKVETAVTEAWFDPKQFIMYGLGGLLIAREKTRDKVSGGYKLTNTESWATGKLSNDIDKIPIPGIPNVEIRENKRVIVQEYEKVEGQRLLEKVYDHGEIFFKGNDLDAIDEAKKRLKETFEYIDFPSEDSAKTKEAKIHVQKKFAKSMA